MSKTTNELPPETARRFLDLRQAVASSANDPRVSRALNAITDDDIDAMVAHCPDKALYTLTIRDDYTMRFSDDLPTQVLSKLLSRSSTSPGTYDHYERAGWVKREPSPKVAKMAEDTEGLLCGDAPEEWGPWVKLATVGERPDVEFGGGEQVRMRHGGEATSFAAGSWLCVTHYRRKRIRCIYTQGAPGGDYTAWCAKDGHDAHAGLADSPGHYALRGTTWTPATVPEVTAAKAGRDPNGVVAWHGGECPVGAHDCITVHYRDGSAPESGYCASNYEWDHADDPTDIIAYEVAG